MIVGVKDSADTIRKISNVVTTAIQEHGATKEAIIPILSSVNKVFGYIPSETFEELRQQLHKNQVVVSEGQLFSIASFYHMLSIRPRGRHVVRFCESAPCHVMGGRELFNAIQDELNLQPGETSLDKKWSFITTSCLGICGVGPVILVDEDVYGNVKPNQLQDIFAKYD
jgi:NADH:ubiquinone oxidoreductase subunit E